MMETTRMMIAEGFDAALIGYAWSRDSERVVTAYSVQKCLEILMERDGMTEEQASEYFQYNVEGTLLGDATPIWVWEATVEQVREYA